MELEPTFMAEVAQREVSELTKIIEEIDEKKTALEEQRKRMEALLKIFSLSQHSPLFWVGGENTVSSPPIDGGLDDSPTEIIGTPTESKSG